VAEATRQADFLVSGDPSITLNEVHSGPETGWLFGSCAQWFPTQAGSAGRPVPGRTFAIVDETGRILPAGHAGNIAVHKTDPALFTEYQGDADKTAASFRNDWFLTGDVGYKTGWRHLHPAKMITGVRCSAVCPEPDT
jgi:acyl-coenzyme A synthetase/AMP-(fatty) acid ligase